ncbi:hypothetical protein Nepgr_017723 [Nepenthes gracilis]|uniref:Uncharacterized protein n=1 Tax=Nepenthes gracilis TaxID=150966 RepID=A0AAD3XSE9_NEPGR|nr:hypothetical protein Nepgr_017723 [Nepenthes gracilis]
MEGHLCGWTCRYVTDIYEGFAILFFGGPMPVVNFKNGELFRGFTTTPTVRVSLLEILEILLEIGTSQPACEEALFGASYHGRVGFVELLMGFDLIHPHVLMHALVTTYDIVVRLGAWSWDIVLGEEFQVGAGFAKQHVTSWCTIKYFEARGTILCMLLEHQSPNTPHHENTNIHHVIPYANTGALTVLLRCGVDLESPITTNPFKQLL